MKRVKKITFLLIVLLAVVGILFKGKITAFAETYAFDKLELNKIYKKGDIIEIMGEFNGSGFDAIYIEEPILIVYENKNKEVLSSYIPVFQSGMILPSITVGATCKDNAENLENFLKQLNLTEEEIAQEKMQVSMLCGAYLELYNGEQKAQSKIEQWQIVESKYEYTYEYCENTEEFKNSTICTAIKEGGSSVVELALMPVITFREYTEPTFTLNCNPTTLKHNEKTTCELIVNTQTEITEIKTDINTGDLIIKELKPEEGWTIEKEENSYIIKTEKPLIGEEKVLSAILEAPSTSKETINITLENMSYITNNNEQQATTPTTNIKVEAEEVENPETNDIRVVLLISAIAIAAFIGIQLYDKKKALN